MISTTKLKKMVASRIRLLKCGFNAMRKPGNVSIASARQLLRAGAHSQQHYPPARIGCSAIHITRSGVKKIVQAMQLSNTDVLAWIGCGAGQEIIEIGRIVPGIKIVAWEIDATCCAHARALRDAAVRRGDIQKNNTIYIYGSDFAEENVLRGTFDELGVTKVYSMAHAGLELYDHILKFVVRAPKVKGIMMMRHMWSLCGLGPNSSDMSKYTWTRAPVHFSASSGGTTLFYLDTQKNPDTRKTPRPNKPTPKKNQAGKNPEPNKPRQLLGMYMLWLHKNSF